MRYHAFVSSPESELRLALILLAAFLFHQKVKYKEDGRKEMNVSLYSLLPDTLDAQRAKELRDAQSDVRPSSPEQYHPR